MTKYITMKERLGHKKQVVNGNYVERMYTEAFAMLADILRRDKHGRRVYSYKLHPSLIEQLTKRQFNVTVLPGPDQKMWSKVKW